jgi:hypothetical protein
VLDESAIADELIKSPNGKLDERSTSKYVKFEVARAKALNVFYDLLRCKLMSGIYH